MWAPSSFQPIIGNFCPISALAHFRFKASLGNKSCKQGKDSHWDSFFQHHFLPKSQCLKRPWVCLNFSLGSRMKRNLHVQPFFFFPWHLLARGWSFVSSTLFIWSSHFYSCLWLPNNSGNYWEACKGVQPKLQPCHLTLIILLFLYFA